MHQIADGLPCRPMCATAKRIAAGHEGVTFAVTNWRSWVEKHKKVSKMGQGGQ
jgi:hypothetical protein